MLHTFEEISIRAKKSAKCLCGKRRTRQITFTQTLNPFNKKDGRLKSRYEICEELEIERDEWMKELIYCEEPSFYNWTDEQKEQYENTGRIIIEIECGSKIEKIKPF